MQTSEDGDTVEGYHIHVGGGFGPDAAIAREIYHDVKAEDAPRTVERLLKAYLAHRTSPQESFLAFTRRHDIDALRVLGRARGGRMSSSRPPIPSLIPETAPFSAEQRVWLNGLFAGLLSLEQGVTPLSPEQAAALLPGGFDLGASPAPSTENDDDAPWHDPAMPLPERMKLAEGRPLRRRLMAAMGQQDCGQCGYNCQDYSDAIFSQKEERLNLCVPGGKETARMLKALHQELGKPPAAPAAPTTKTPTPAAATAAPAAAPGRSRDNPAEAVFSSRTRLNKPGSAQGDLAHRVRSRRNAASTMRSAMPSALFPTNDPALADAVIAALGAPADFPIGGRTLRDVLIDGVSLGAAPDMLFQLFSYITGGERRQKAKALADGDDPDGDAATLDVLAAIQKFSGVRPDPEAFIEALDPLQPRLYSIASSPKVDPRRHRAHRRYGALSDQRPHPARRRLHLSRRPRRARATGSRSMCRRRSTSDCRPTRRCRSS